jgi:cellulose synthase/poly-beta-1,6-N-acetylglucosamine synthase-like glycosyltransferase
LAPLAVKLAGVTFLIALVLAPLALLTFCFAVELLVGVKPLCQDATPDKTASGVIVVPAHNEAAILESRLSALVTAASGRARILLVADNCTDSTAEIARRFGVSVVERFDDERRGKGFALDFARQSLEADPPEVVLIVDADCTMDGESISRLVARCAAANQPCQAVNLQAPTRDASPAVQLSTFAFYIKNVVRQRALQRIAGRVHLLGTGMALPWPAFARAELATDHIVEDLKMGLELAEAGHGPVFAEDAAVWSSAETEKNTLAQRQRWEGGFLQNAFRTGPQMLLRSVSRGDARGTWAAIDVLIPPFALLLTLDVAALVWAVAVTSLTNAAQWPLLVLGSSIALAGGGLVLAWINGGSRFVSLSSLARAPLYLLWKLPLYVGLIRRGVPKEWLRTNRQD